DDGSGSTNVINPGVPIWTTATEGSSPNPMPTNTDWGGEAGPPLANFKTIVKDQTYPELNNGKPNPPDDHADLAGHKLLWRAEGPRPVGVLQGSPGGPFDKSGVGASAGLPNVTTVADAAANIAVAPDNLILTSADLLTPDAQFQEFLKNVNGGHNYIHQYING